MHSMCAVYLLDSQFIQNTPKFISGCLVRCCGLAALPRSIDLSDGIVLCVAGRAISHDAAGVASRERPYQNEFVGGASHI